MKALLREGHRLEVSQRSNEGENDMEPQELLRSVSELKTAIQDHAVKAPAWGVAAYLMAMAEQEVISAFMNAAGPAVAEDCAGRRRAPPTANRSHPVQPDQSE